MVNTVGGGGGGKRHLQPIRIQPWPEHSQSSLPPTPTTDTNLPIHTYIHTINIYIQTYMKYVHTFVVEYYQLYVNIVYK